MRQGDTQGSWYPAYYGIKLLTRFMTFPTLEFNIHHKTCTVVGSVGRHNRRRDQFAGNSPRRTDDVSCAGAVYDG